MKKNKKILVCPLDWGLGHATRCIPVIRKLLDRGAEVVIAADQRPYALLNATFPGLPMIRFPGYQVRYPAKRQMTRQIIKSIPFILKGIRAEHRKLNSLLQQYPFNALISDNRFGLYHDRIPCVYMTHQVMIKAPEAMAFLEPLLHRAHRHYIRKYDECWIPDFPGEDNLSGSLGHRYEPRVKTSFVGPLSRFEQGNASNGKPGGSALDMLVVISGPEPQRGIFEKTILTQLRALSCKAVVILGLPDRGEEAYDLNGHTMVYSHLETYKLQQFMQEARHIVCRSGYSSIMDLYALKRRAFLVPTPGQTEQEYLAGHLSKKGFPIQSQDAIDLAKVMSAESLPVWAHDDPNKDLLGKAVDDLMENI